MEFIYLIIGFLAGGAIVLLATAAYDETTPGKCENGCTDSDIMYDGGHPEYPFKCTSCGKRY